MRVDGARRGEDTDSEGGAHNRPANRPGPSDGAGPTPLRQPDPKQPDDWRHFYTQSLGGSLLGQQQYAAAEPLLLQGYQGLKAQEKQIPAAYKIRPTDAIERLVQLYDAWGRPAQA